MGYLVLFILAGIALAVQALSKIIEGVIVFLSNLVNYSIEAAPLVLSRPLFWVILCAGITMAIGLWLILARRARVQSLEIDVSLQGNSVTYKIHESRQVSGGRMDNLKDDLSALNSQSDKTTSSEVSYSPAEAVTRINERIRYPFWRIGERSTTLFYYLDSENEKAFSNVQEALAQLTVADRLWHVTSQNVHWDYKRNAGTNTSVVRSRIEIGSKEPSHLRLDLTINSINAKVFQLFFLPDHVWIFERGQYQAISYDALQITTTTTQFVENESVPRDANVIGSTWQYVNKNGSPDLRFKNNRQLPVVQYANVEISVASSWRITLMISSVIAAQRFAQAFLDHKRPKSSENRSSGSGYTKQDKKSPSSPKGPSAKTPYEVLGVSPGASDEELTSAYRRMAKQYHPDRVADLGPEFRQLAEERMKEINAAYEAVRSR